MRPQVSIVMPCYNAARHLPRSIGSVQAQTFGGWELIAVDDGSTDDTWAVLSALAAQDGRIRPVQQANAGAAAARNRGLDEAGAPLVAFLDADDTWEPEFLQKMSAALADDPQAGIAYCGWQQHGLGGGRDEPFVPPEYETGDKVDVFLGGCRWPIHAALTRRALIMEAGKFDATLSSCMDYDLWLRLAPQVRLVRVPEVLAHYWHHGGGQITSNRARIALNHWRAQRKFLATHPEQAAHLGARRVRELTAGELLQRGYASYWRRDLPAARAIFRAVMRQGYGGVRDWAYMLPAWLPLPWHAWLLQHRDRKVPHADHR
jgi:glycosyltransferase involved in cell wall biosynthesis